MLIEANFGSLLSGRSTTNASKAQKTGFVSTPSNAFMKAMSNEGSIFSLAQDKKDYKVDTQTVAYNNMFSFINGSDNSDNSEASAFLG